MINKINELGFCKEKGRITSFKDGTFGLSRWDKVWGEIQNSIPLNPITVIKKPRGYYGVIDGRHRATESLCAGFDFVPPSLFLIKKRYYIVSSKYKC